VDHRVVEFAATMPSNIKFRDGTMKHVLRQAMADVLPAAILDRKDKMGFPVPLQAWMRGPLREFVQDVFGSSAALDRELIDNQLVRESLDREPTFGRKVWGLLCLELWQQEFRDQDFRFKNLIEAEEMIGCES
jgi:asparagine synthase (glutamine-hydrolysing)